MFDGEHKIMMIKGKASTLSGLVSAQPSTLSGLGRLLGLGDCTEDDDGNIACDIGDPTPSPTPVTTTPITTTPLTGTCAVWNADGTCGTWNAPSTTTPGVTGATNSTNWGSLLSNIFGDAASVASTALKSSTQTCQVINGATVCTTTTSGGAPTSSVSGLLGSSSTPLLMIGLGVLVLMMFTGKK